MMKTTIVLFSAAVAFTGCKKEEEKKEDKPAASKTADKASAKKAPAAQAPAAPALEMAPIDVVYEEFKATMNAPKGAVFKEEYGTLEVKLGSGKDFFIQIDTDTDSLDDTKKFVQNNDVQKLQKFHVETADTLIYETKAMGRTSFWLDTLVKVGETSVRCYSGRGANSYSKAQIELFEKSCKSLQAK